MQKIVRISRRKLKHTCVTATPLSASINVPSNTTPAHTQAETPGAQTTGKIRDAVSRRTGVGWSGLGWRGLVGRGKGGVGPMLEVLTGPRGAESEDKHHV